MANIIQDFPIKAPLIQVFDAISTPAGLDQWWTAKSAGKAAVGEVYELWFGQEYDWRAKVSKCIPNQEFELEMIRADNDWNGTRIGLRLESRSDMVWVQFHHEGWPESNEHFRISSHCWAMYLRVLRRFLEHGETVPYDVRLSV